MFKKACVPFPLFFALLCVALPLLLGARPAQAQTAPVIMAIYPYSDDPDIQPDRTINSGGNRLLQIVGAYFGTRSLARTVYLNGVVYQEGIVDQPNQDRTLYIYPPNYTVPTKMSVYVVVRINGVDQTSNTRTLNAGIPRLIPTITSAVRNADQSVSVTVSVMNEYVAANTAAGQTARGAAARLARITGGTLGSSTSYSIQPVSTTTAMPIALLGTFNPASETLYAGETASNLVTLVFPSTVGVKGESVRLRLTGDCTPTRTQPSTRVLVNFNSIPLTLP